MLHMIAVFSAPYFCFMISKFGFLLPAYSGPFLDGQTALSLHRERETFPLFFRRGAREDNPLLSIGSGKSERPITVCRAFELGAHRHLWGVFLFTVGASVFCAHLVRTILLPQIRARCPRILPTESAPGRARGFFLHKSSVQPGVHFRVPRRHGWWMRPCFGDASVCARAIASDDGCGQPDLAVSELHHVPCACWPWCVPRMWHTGPRYAY